jgi:hypothetical protein
METPWELLENYNFPGNSWNLQAPLEQIELTNSLGSARNQEGNLQALQKKEEAYGQLETYELMNSCKYMSDLVTAGNLNLPRESVETCNTRALGTADNLETPGKG